MRFPLVALAAAGGALLLLLLAGPSYRAGLSLQTAFALLRWGAYAGLTAAALGGAAAAVAYRGRRRAAAAVALVACLGGLFAFAIPFAWLRRVQSAPPIHDISTDLENPPAFDAVVPLRADAPNTLERPPALASLQREGYPDLQPITLPHPPSQTFDRALAVAQSRGWEIVTADKAAGRIEATDTTRWFGFTDDVAVRITPWGTGTRVDVRSVSRVGNSDMGTNAERIESFLEQLADD